MSENSVFIRHLAPKNFLSFGPDNPGIDLGSLNVLIGPNGSGKSNLIEAIGFMRSAPNDLRDVMRRGGGVSEWIWKGQPKGAASVEWTASKPRGIQPPLNHLIAFSSRKSRFVLDQELIQDHGVVRDESSTFYRNDEGVPKINSRVGGKRQLTVATIEQPDRSILAQRRDPESYPELSWLSSSYERIRIYREWTFGRSTVLREPQRADMRNDVLEEDFSNLGMILNKFIARSPVIKTAILEGLKDLYPSLRDVQTYIEGGTVQVFFTEGEFSIPATRLSDGTLRYLCLLTILCDPEPPPLICIEEPELGLHPDIIPKLADLLLSASIKTQLIVTTHSDILVDAMSDNPEAVVVCSKESGKSCMERLDPTELAEWLKRYRLGELWIKGQIGGTRW